LREGRGGLERRFVEGEGGAEVDEAEDAGREGGEVDGVIGDVAFAIYA